jgi:outer membrane immunogenic protein
MLKRFSLNLLAATAIGVVASHGAFAADMGLPVKAPPVAPPPPLFNWTGLYVGGVFGAGISRNKLSETSNGLQGFVGEGLCFNCAFESNAFSPGRQNFGTQIGVGPQGGFVLGYKWQAPNSPFVWGIDGQFSFADLQGSTNDSRSATFTGGGCGSVSCVVNANVHTNISSQVKDIATIAGVFGMTSGPQDRTLWYVKGGGAWANTHWSASDQFNGSRQDFNPSCFLTSITSVGCVNGLTNNFSNTGSAFSSADKNRWGWMVGTGVEFGLWGNWSAKIEYDFLDFGSYDVALNGTVGLSNSESISFTRNLHVDQQIHLVQVGVNYKFDWGNWGHW